MKIVTLGGSFNPPTLAHYRIMEAALDFIRAECGIYVPVSEAYLRRKMYRHGGSLCLPEPLRCDMLQAMCETDPRMQTSDCEFGTVAARSYDTLSCLQEQFPEAELFFIVGADKLPMIVQWAEHTDFLQRFQIIICARQGIDPMAEILSTPVLTPWASRFTVLPIARELEQISSTAVRNALDAGQRTDGLLHPGVTGLLGRITPAMRCDEVIQFKGEFDFLSNLYPAPITWAGIVYPCVESAYQASKSDDLAVRLRLSGYAPEQVRARAHKLHGSAEWAQNQLALMKELVLLKFGTHPELAERLKATGERQLIHGTGKDTYWGVDLYAWKGDNHLGQILMEVRHALQQTVGH